MATYTAISGASITTIKARVVCASCGKVYSVTKDDVESSKFTNNDEQESIASTCPYCNVENINRTNFLHFYTES